MIKTLEQTIINSERVFGYEDSDFIMDQVIHYMPDHLIGNFTETRKYVNNEIEELIKIKLRKKDKENVYNCKNCIIEVLSSPTPKNNYYLCEVKKTNDECSHSVNFGNTNMCIYNKNIDEYLKNQK